MSSVPYDDHTSLADSFCRDVDNPITNGKEPVALARAIADWVKKNNMAGVDIDLEDAQAMNKNVAIDWIVSE